MNKPILCPPFSSISVNLSIYDNKNSEPRFFQKRRKKLHENLNGKFLMKRFNINITMRRKTRGLQLLLRIHFNNNNKLIVCLQECFHNVQNVSRLRHEHNPFSCSICNLFAIFRQVFASMTSVTMVNA